jgi:hypothetical protein
MAEYLLLRRYRMNNHDDSDVSLESYESMIEDAPDGEWNEFPFDEKSWFYIAPLKAGLSTIGGVEKISSELGKLTSTKVTKAEVELLVEHYLKEIKKTQNTCMHTKPDWARLGIYGGMRIEYFIKSKAISLECYKTLYDNIFSDDDTGDDSDETIAGYQ